MNVRNGEKPKRVYTPDPNRLLPQAPDAEKGLLSSFLIDPREIGGLCAEKGLTEEWFAIPAHGLIFRNLMAMWDKNEAIDFITLTDWLRDHDLLDQCGGAGFVTELFTFLPTAANAPWYIDILAETRTLRRVITVCTEYAGRGYDEKNNVEGLVDKLEGDVLAIRGDASIDTLLSAKQAVIIAMGQIDEMYARKGSISGMATGFSELDRVTDGMHAAEIIVIAGRPSNGKTAFAMNIVEYVAIDLQQPVGVFSLEMTTPQLIQRMICSRAHVNLAKVREGFLSDRDFPAMQSAASKIAAAPIYIDDKGGMTIQQLRAKARRMKQQRGITLLIVDYLQLVLPVMARQNNREQDVAEVSMGLKNLAKELSIPVLVLCQINRKFEERALNGRPRLSDLRESGSIEQDADTVIFIVRQELYAEDEDQKRELEGKADLIIAKQRHGPTGDVALTFLKEYTRFVDRAKCEEEHQTVEQELPI